MATERKLYEIAGEYQAMVAEVQTGDLSLDELGAAAGLLAQTKAELAGKIEACMRARRNMEIDADVMIAEAKVFDAESKRLKAAAGARGNEIARLNDYVAHNLTAADINSVKTDIGTVFLRRSTRLDVGDEAVIPDAYQRVTIAVDKVALRLAVEAGEFSDEHVSLVESVSVSIR